MSPESSAMKKEPAENESHLGIQARPISSKVKRLWTLILLIFLFCFGVGVGVGVGVTRQKYTHRLHSSQLCCPLINGAAQVFPISRPWTI